MGSTTSLAVSLTLLIISINIGMGMVTASGFAAEMGVDGMDLGIGNDINAAANSVDDNSFTPVAIGSAFAGFTINGIKVLVKVFALIVIGVPAILYTAGAPVWVVAPITGLFVVIQGLAAMGLYFGGTV